MSRRSPRLEESEASVSCSPGAPSPRPPTSPPPERKALSSHSRSRGERARARLRQSVGSDESQELDVTPARPPCHVARAQGRNWRGVNRQADAGTTQPDLAQTEVRLAANGVHTAELSKEVFLERWGAKEPGALGEQWAQECSPGPKRAARWGAAQGLSSQYSHAGETWWERSTTAAQRRTGPFTSNLLPSQRPMPLEEEGHSTTAPCTPGAVEASCLCTKGACNCVGDAPCYRWPSGRPPYGAGNLPPLRGAEGGQSHSLGLSLAPPAPTTAGLPPWVQAAQRAGTLTC